MNALHNRLDVTLDSLLPVEQRLRSSLLDDRAWFPITAQSLMDGNVDAQRVRDAFLQRFQQASDLLLRKLFPRLLAVIEASPEPVPFVDVLERLHRFGLLDEPHDWATLNELRNRLVHDYVLDRDELAEDFNLAWAMSDAVLGQIDRLRRYAIDHHLLSEGKSS